MKMVLALIVYNSKNEKHCRSLTIEEQLSTVKTVTTSNRETFAKSDCKQSASTLLSQFRAVTSHMDKSREKF